MKRFIMVVIGLGALTAVAYMASLRQTAVTTEAPAAADAETGEMETVERPDTAVAAGSSRPAKSDRASRGTEAPTETATQAQSRASSVFFDQAIETVSSGQTTFEQRQEAWKLLRRSGRLDAAIEILEERVSREPRSAEYAAALGMAYWNKCGAVEEIREQAILAMRADGAFEAALALDPTLWEARYNKAVGMSYWPKELGKTQETIDHFRTLIEQQEKQAAQPHFAGTYARLGEQYEKAGQLETARQIWQRGASLFPQNRELQKRLGKVD